MNNKIKLVKTDKSWIESNALDQLEVICKLKGIEKAVGFPDLHAGKTPVGAAYIFKDMIYPHLVGNDIGCGMSLFSTGIKKSKFKRERTFEKLQRLGGLENVDISDMLLNLELPFKEKLGTIGGGNHFAEFQEVQEVFDIEELDKLLISKSDIYLLVHSGSRTYGEYILRKYIEEYSCQNGLNELSDGFKAYITEHEKAVNYARLNRELIAYRLLNAVNAKENVKLLDSVHNGITIKELDEEKIYIHRKGAAPSDVGCVVVAGTRGSNSYIVKPKDNLYDYAFSISHGAGRKWQRLGCKERLENIYSKKSMVVDKLTQSLIYKDKNSIYEEAPQAYKNIERVIEDMLEEDMITLVASLNPLITYKA